MYRSVLALLFAAVLLLGGCAAGQQTVPKEKSGQETNMDGAAFDRSDEEITSIRATALIWPSPGLEPSRFGKLRVVWRMENSPLAGVSPAPKQGPQKHSRKMPPAETMSATAPFLTSSR